MLCQVLKFLKVQFTTLQSVACAKATGVIGFVVFTPLNVMPSMVILPAPLYSVSVPFNLFLNILFTEELLQLKVTLPLPRGAMCV